MRIREVGLGDGELRNGRIGPLACALLCVLALAALPLLAQEGQGGPGEMSPEMAAMMEAMAKAAAPGEPHQKLARGEGTWAMTVKFWADGPEPMVSQGTATRKMIMGGRYLEEKVDSTAMGQPFKGYSLTGYDNVKGEYWSLWIDDMSTGAMVSHGKEDDSGKVVFHGTYADPTTGNEAKVKMVSWMEGEDKEIFEMWEDRGGEMVKSMEITMLRQ